jgi:adenosylcobinamide-phosphate synthase
VVAGAPELAAATGERIGLGAIADQVFGDPARRHPVAGFGRVARGLEQRLWRPRRRAGVLYALALVGGAAAAARLVDGALRPLRAAEPLFVALTVWTVLGGRSLAHEARALADEVERGRLEAARQRAPALVGRDPTTLDGAELCRAAVESVAENTADAVAAPLLWCAFAGPAGAVAYRAANTLDARVGHRSKRYERFGWAAARLDDALTWPAARLAALFAVLLAPAVGGNPGQAWWTLRRDGRAHPSPNAGLLEAAFAGALGVRLGGRNRYGGRVEVRPVLGDGELPVPSDVRRAVRLSQLIGAASTFVAVLLALGRRR